MKRILVVTVLSIVLLVGGSQVSAATQTLTFNGRYDFNYVTTGWAAEGIVDPYVDFLALRTGPSTSYSLITRIPPGARVQVGGEQGGPATWGRGFEYVSYRGMHGYAHSKYIALIPNTVRYLP